MMESVWSRAESRSGSGIVSAAGGGGGVMELAVTAATAPAAAESRLDALGARPYVVFAGIGAVAASSRSSG